MIKYLKILWKRLLSAPKVVILTGIGGQGKTTFAKRKLKNHIRLSRDDLGEEGELFKFVEMIKNGNDIVIDDTNLKKQKRAKFINIAKKYGAIVESYFMKPNVKQALKRNRKRNDSISEIAIHVHESRYERPTYDEGFDLIKEIT